MSDKVRILCFAGSLRKDSWNKKMVKEAMAIAQANGAECTFVDLKDLPMPIYDGDIEAESGIPENAKKFRLMLKEHDGFLIASPEYNSTISAALKNAIDWASRPDGSDVGLVGFTGKSAGVMAASPGLLGGMRGLVSLRMLLGNIGVMVVTPQHAQAKAPDAFDENGKLKDEKARAAVEKIVVTLIKLIKGQKL